MTMYLDVLVRTLHLTIIQVVKISNIDMTVVMSVTITKITRKRRW